VTPAQEIASLVPAAGATLDEDDIRAAEQIFAVREERAVERFAELCVSMLSQIPLISRSGDPGGARRVLSVLNTLLSEHDASGAKKLPRPDGTLPLSLALSQIIDQAVAALPVAPSETERDLISRLLQLILANAQKEDGVISLLAMKVSDEAKTLAEFGALYSAGCRAAQLGSGPELFSVQSKFGKLAPGTASAARYANEVSGRLVLYCAIVAPQLSRAVWTRWWQAAKTTPEQDRYDICGRIGAGALPAGNLSLAVEVALAMRGAEFDRLVERARRSERAAFENTLSRLYGRLLGSDAERRIVSFLEFAKTVNEVVA
jgi:hypothetical protein